MPFGYHNSAKITRGKCDGQENKRLSELEREIVDTGQSVKMRFQMGMVVGHGRTDAGMV